MIYYQFVQDGAGESKEIFPKVPTTHILDSKGNPIGGRLETAESKIATSESNITTLDNTTYKKSEWTRSGNQDLRIQDFPNGYRIVTGRVSSVTGKGYAPIPLQNHFSEVDYVDAQLQYLGNISEMNKAVITSIQPSATENTNVYFRLLTGEAPTQNFQMYFFACGIKK